MRRALVTATLVILFAVVGSVTFGAWITWTYVLPEFEGASTYLSPGLKFPLATVKAALARVPDRDPAQLAAELGVPVVAMDERMRSEFFAVPPLAVPFSGGETFYLRVEEGNDLEYAALATARGATLRLGPLAGLTPFQPSTVVVWGGIMLAFALVASPIILVPWVRQVRRLELTAQRLSAGELAARAPVTGPTRELGQALNTMAERTGRLIRSHEELLQAVAHELRTPAARVRFHLELLGAAKEPEARARHAAAIERDLDEFDALVDELLAFERLGVDAQGMPKRALPVEETLRELTVAEGRSERVVTLEGPAEAVVHAEPRAFRRALGNLLSNALRAADGRVRIGWHVAGQQLVIEVDDDGPGVPPDQRERIFRPFIVGDASRSKSSGGLGLGLAIVRRIVELHGGEVRVEDAPLGGARFIATWPLGAVA
jgi:two-component system sensor histidine kinase RstB